jgi:hypothetical protein
LFMDVSGMVHFGVYPPVAAGQANPNPGVFKIVGSPKPLNDGAWHQATARLSPQGQALFIDGVEVALDPVSTVAENIRGYWRWGYGALEGWSPPGASRYFQGNLDEICVAHAARSDAFIALLYENQKPDSRLLEFP